jgi:hypothetical protein
MLRRDFFAGRPARWVPCSPQCSSSRRAIDPDFTPQKFQASDEVVSATGIRTSRLAMEQARSASAAPPTRPASAPGLTSLLDGGRQDNGLRFDRRLLRQPPASLRPSNTFLATK